MADYSEGRGSHDFDGVRSEMAGGGSIQSLEQVIHFVPMSAATPNNATSFTVRASDGVALSCWARGEGPATLLLVHGWGGSGSGRFWTPLLGNLDLSGIRVIAADLRGHGKSDQTRLGFSIEGFAKDLFAVADQAGAKRPIVVSYSMSGKWVQWMSCMEPERVRGQILIAPAPALALPLGDEMLNDWLTAARDRSRFDPWLRQFVKEPLAPDVMDAYFEDVSSTAEYSLRETFNMCRTGGFADALSATSAPTLAICGMHDPVLPPQLVRKEIVDRIPGARLAVIDCGHEAPLEKPLETAALIEAFVAGFGRVNG